MSSKEQSKGSESASECVNYPANTLTSDQVSRNWHNLDNRLSLIAEAAYFKAARRGFEPGHEEADWLEAEQELAKIMGVA